MAVAQIGSLIDFVADTTMVSSDVDSNFTDIRTAFNNLVTGADQLAGGLTANGAFTVVGDVLIGTATAATGSPALDVVGNGVTTATVAVASSTTNAANKQGQFVVRHYTNAQEPVRIVGCAALTATSVVHVGGGHSSFNAATAVEFYTAADTTTVTGTLAVNLTGVGATSTLRTIGHLKCDAVFRQTTVTTLADDATPTVAASNLFKTGGTTTITDLDDGVVGQTIRILSGHSITITDGTNILLNGSANFVMAAGDVLVLTMYNDQVWVEDARQVN